jgi:hypothetical protein
MKTRKSWTDTEVTLLRLRYADTLTTDLAQQIGRPVQHVYAKAGRLGLRKGPQFIASSASGRILKGGRLSQATQFQTGHAPANKGLRRPGFAPGNMASTQFKSVFPDTRLIRGGQSKDRLQTTQGGMATFVGVGGSLTGRGAHALIIDDLIKDYEQARSKAFRDRAWEWFTKVAMTRRMGRP